MTYNPYQDIDWALSRRIVGCTHMHCLKQEQFDAFIQGGLEAVSLTNYYPSAPSYPLSQWRKNGSVYHQFGYVKDGQWHKESISFAEVIQNMGGDLSRLPLGELMIPNVPESIFEVPNAEHASFSDVPPQLHLTALGCLLASGSFDLKEQWHLAEAGYSKGCGVPWRDAVRAMLDSLIAKDGGGVIICHPVLSGLSESLICSMLDFDPRVLGIEVYNHSASKEFSGFADSLWDRILSTGRRCLGFFVTDQPEDEWWGKIIVLAQERTPTAYLKAVRQGAFYGVLTDSGVRFESIQYEHNELKAVCNREVFFQVMSCKGITAEASGKTFRFAFTDEQRRELGYLRLTATINSVDKLYAQPIML